MTRFKDFLPIIAVGAAAYFLFNRDKRTPSDSSFGASAAAPSFSSPVAQDAFANIFQTYGQQFTAGVLQAVQNSKTTTEALQSIAKLPTTNAQSSSLRRISGSSDTQRLVQQTSLKSGFGGGTGLKDGSYKISGLGTVTVKSGPAKKNAANLRTYTGR